MSTTTREIPRYVSADELAQALGLSVRTIRRWTKERRISFLRTGHSAARYDLAQVINELTQKKEPSVEEKKDQSPLVRQ